LDRMLARAYASASWMVSDYDDDSEGKIGDTVRLQQGPEITNASIVSVSLGNR
jgi:hypothetical protein